MYFRGNTCIGYMVLLVMGALELHLASGQQFNPNRTTRHSPYKSCIIVDQSGQGKFTTVQSAIDSVPSYNDDWLCIFIKAGIYREKVKIPYDKPYIILKGEGRRRTQIVWDDHYSVAQSPTFSSLADNIVVKGITFVNSYNFPNYGEQGMVPAVAVMVFGDKISFYRCRFAGIQDTLWDGDGRHYFKNCTIQGAVDFIFGSGQSIYEGCVIQVLGEGFITAQGRTNPNDGNGFVFKDCFVTGKGSAYLGRPWRGYARVLFYNSNFSDVIQPEGWDSWNFKGREDQITFAEYGNYGPGALRSSRVSWETRLSPQSLEALTSLAFVSNDNWIQNQPN